MGATLQFTCTRACGCVCVCVWRSMCYSLIIAWRTQHVSVYVNGYITPLKIHKYVAKTLIKTKSIANICAYAHTDKNKNALKEKKIARSRVSVKKATRAKKEMLKTQKTTTTTTVTTEDSRARAGRARTHRIKMFCKHAHSVHYVCV